MRRSFTSTQNPLSGMPFLRSVRVTSDGSVTSAIGRTGQISVLEPCCHEHRKERLLEGESQQPMKRSERSARATRPVRDTCSGLRLDSWGASQARDFHSRCAVTRACGTTRGADVRGPLFRMRLSLPLWADAGFGMNREPQTKTTVKEETAITLLTLHREV
jgi:hypothetical protein